MTQFKLNIINRLHSTTLISLFLSIFFTSPAQENDSTKFTGTYFVFDLNYHPKDSCNPDTSLSNFHNLFNTYNGFISLKPEQEGSPTLPASILILPVGEELITLNFSDYNFHFFNTPFYNVSKPFTRINYVNTGPKNAKFQRLNILHTQQFIKKINTGLRLNNINSIGYFTNQENKDMNLSGWFSYAGNKYKIHSSISANRYKNQENGGISETEELESGNYDSEKFIPVNLEKARNRIVNNEFAILQEFKPGILSLFNPSLLLYSVFDNSSRRFQDDGNNDAYYQNFGIDSVIESDSSRIASLTNHLSLRFKRDSGSIDLNQLVGIRHQFIHFFHQSDTSFHLIAFNYGIQTILNENTKLSLQASYHLPGYRAHDYILQLRFKYTGGRSAMTDPEMGFSLIRETPSWIHSIYTAETYPTHELNRKQLVAKLTGGASIPAMKVNYQIVIGSVTNPYFFNEQAKLSFLPSRYPFIQINFRQQFVWRKFSFLHQLTWQEISGESWNFVPDLVLKGSMFYDKAFFKKELQVQFGIHYLFMNSYSAPGYFPLYGIFFNQNDHIYGESLNMDVFFRMKIKSVMFLFQLNHLNQGWIGDYPYLSHPYPGYPRRFTFGITWSFYD
jgi:hypothetical protein